MKSDTHKPFLVSVIIPVYNAASFVEEAVLSAVNLTEVGEIILIEDGSKDNSLEKCVLLENKFSKVKLYTHESNKNKGASESRNLGITKSSFPIISFLDADDVYCKNRFKEDKSLFLKDTNIDGCYSAVRYLNEPFGKVFTIRKKVPPSKLFHYLLRGTYGHFHINGVTLKKDVFNTVGYFNPILQLHQDAEMWLRVSFLKNLIQAEQEESVALIRRHEGNRIWKGVSSKSKHLAYKTFYNWVINKKIKIIDLFLLVRKISILQHKIENRSYIQLLLNNIIKALKNNKKCQI